MSHPQKKKREIFLLSKLRISDFLLFFGAIAWLASLFLLVPRFLDRLNTLAAPFKTEPRFVPARAVQATQNTSLLWNKDEYIYGVPTGGYFYIVNGQNLVSPRSDLTDGTFVLEDIDIVTGQTQWQTQIPEPDSIVLYDNKFFVLSMDWLEQAPAKNNQELVYCSFWEKFHSLSAYHANTGQEIWSYGYQGSTSSVLTFTNQTLYLAGFHNHGKDKLLIDVDINTGLILDQRCNVSDTTQPWNRGKIDSADAFFIRPIDAQEYNCSEDNRVCLATKENRLHILTGDPKQTTAYIEFAGATLTPAYMDGVVHNDIVIVHLDDSDQLFAFRLP